jgi:hypothetical protein
MNDNDTLVDDLRKDSLALMKLLADEKHKSEALAAELERERAGGTPCFMGRQADRIRALEAALHRYGRHNGLCGNYKCVCGLDDLLGIAVAAIPQTKTKGEDL